MAWTPEKKRRIYNEQGRACVKCGSPHNLTIDHIIPIALVLKFGLKTWGDEARNLQVLCTPCNTKKGGDLDFSNENTIPLLRDLLARVEFLHVPVRKRAKYVWRTLDIESKTPETFFFVSEREALKAIYTRQRSSRL